VNDSIAPTMLVSVGGSPEPVLHALRGGAVSKIIFFVSHGSRSQVFTEILPRLDYRPEHTLVVTDDEQDLGVCVAALLEKVPVQLRELGVSPPWPQRIAYTGGTKTMSAAVVWASSRFPCRFVYVGGVGAARDKSGLGVVRNGREQIVETENPWNRVAYFELRHAMRLYNVAQYGNAAAMLESLEQRVDDREAGRLITTLRFVFEAYHAWDVFAHKHARGLFKRYLPVLLDLAVNPTMRAILPGLKPFASETGELIGVLARIEPSRNSRETVRDLLANARRRALLEHKYEDAVARCYAAMEKLAQLYLHEGFGISTGRCRLAQIPAALREDYVRRYANEDRTGEDEVSLRFGLLAAWDLLAALEHAAGLRWCDSRDDMVEHLRARNGSILAHGLTPVESTSFNLIFGDALRLLGCGTDDLPEFPTFLLE